jgi:hypothetical protein
MNITIASSSHDGSKADCCAEHNLLIQMRLCTDIYLWVSSKVACIFSAVALMESSSSLCSTYLTNMPTAMQSTVYNGLRDAFY